LRLVLIGPPGAGKGTQATRVADAWKIPKISTGDILRRAIASESLLGITAKECMRRGELVSDEIVTDLVAERLADADTQDGFVLDGFPRTLEQALALDVLTEAYSTPAVVEVRVPEDELVRRLRERRTIERRIDDEDATVRERLAVYWRATQPVIDFYKARNALVTVDGHASTDDVTRRINAALKR
jgi:adenylate kinase